MGDEVGYLRAQEEHGEAIEGLKQASADAEGRRKTSHEELLGMTAALLKTSREREAQGESDGKQLPPTAGTAWRDVAPPSSKFSDGDGGSREGERALADVEPHRDQLGRRRQDGGIAPQGRKSSFTHGSQWMVIFRTVKNGGAYLERARKLRVFSKNRGEFSLSSTVLRLSLIATRTIDVGADGNDKGSLTAHREGVTALLYERQLMTWAFPSQPLHSHVDKDRFHCSTSP